ncbi:glycoside hydrolase family 6 protein [Pseudonocardia sp. ICBG1122]|nr:glycoside hydrolase family 6 protein [Pseudonocardia pini]
MSWTAWTPYVLSRNGLGIWDFRFPDVLGTGQILGVLPGAYLGPIASAFLVTAVADGRPGLRRWIGRMWRWRVRWHWYALTLLGVPAAMLVTGFVFSGGRIVAPSLLVVAVYVPALLAHELSGCVDGDLRDECYRLLSEAVAAFKDAGARVYVDAGNPGFISDVDSLAGVLERSGVRAADGFALNVANFYPTPEVVAFGRQLSDRLGGAHFVVDTSRNGRGVADEASLGGVPAFCNPPGRGLGANPTTETGDDRVDALLWVKRPGESDGACRPGEPAAGQWYPDYALGLAQRQAG